MTAVAGMQAPHIEMESVDALDAGAANVAAALPRLAPKASSACHGRIGYVSEADGRCYFTMDTPVSWHMARDQCLQVDAHLATVTAESESAFVARFELASAAWIGLSRFGATNFTWITNEVFSFTHWQAGAPQQLPESAVLITPVSALWSDHSPMEPHPALCETEPTADRSGNRRSGLPRRPQSQAQSQSQGL